LNFDAFFHKLKTKRTKRSGKAGAPSLQQAPSFFKQELAHFSNDQGFVYYEHAVAGVMQFDDPRIFHA
jgi:hypothetical protein